jgi:hypothetical protein
MCLLVGANSFDTVINANGFRVAVVIAAIGVVGVVALAKFAHVNVGFGGVAVVANLVGYRVELRAPAGFVVGLGVLALAGALANHWRSLFSQLLLTLPGAAVVAWSLPDFVPRWVRVVSFLVIAVVAPLVGDSDQTAPRIVPVLAAVSVLGVYACVPDTDLARVLVGGFLVTALLVFSRDLRAVRAGVFPVVGLIVWTAGDGGFARPGSVIGAMACFGAMTLVPLAWRRARTINPWTPAGWLLGLVHLGLVIWCARVAGFRHGWFPALVLVVIGYIAAIVVLGAVRNVRMTSA